MRGSLVRSSEWTTYRHKGEKHRRGWGRAPVCTAAKVEQDQEATGVDLFY